MYTYSRKNVFIFVIEMQTVCLIIKLIAFGWFLYQHIRLLSWPITH